MQRRPFLRLVGGGAVLAAGVGGCAPGLPPEALAAWQGPGAERDLRRWILSHAILAPHSHNLQSWLCDLRVPDEITLRCDPARLLPETDPFARQIMMSHGTFLELLDLAARERGQHAEITPFPEGPYPADRIDGRPVAHIRLQPAPGLARDPLFAQILHRRTNRSRYDPARPVPAAAWAAMAAAAAAPGLRFGHLDAAADAAGVAQQRAIAADAWRLELTTPRAMLESYRWLRIGGDEIARHRDGLSITDATVIWAERLGLFDRRRAPGPDDYATRSQIDDFQAKLDSTPAFLWLVSDDNARASQVRAGRAYARLQLAATAHGLAMQPLQQALQEYPEQAGPHAAIRRRLDATQPGETVQMWARVGHAPAVPPAPRRGVDAQLVKA